MPQIPSKLSYRAEIDGLRAIAVVSVILYHAQIVLFGKDWFVGGYIGVDVFFVISGYLITRIILSELYEKGSFNFLNFYERRARRILPILFLVIFASIPFAWQKLLPSDFVEYAESILASLFFGSNFFFYFSTTEYGADSALLKPFLHTWSLGVEEQFYLIFPILAIIAFKFFRKFFLPILVGLSLLSLQFAELMEVNNSDLNFYLPFSRFWELAAGSLLAYKELNHKTWCNAFGAKLLPAVGLLLVAYSILFFNDKTPHPSYFTIIPILGVALIIGYASKEELIGKVLGSKPFVWLGLISYSVYLWHFPIFAFSRLGTSKHTNYDKLEWIALTLLLSIFSYFIVEKPFRKNVSLMAFKLSMVTSLAVVLCGAHYVIQSDGIPSVARLGFNINIINSISRPNLFYNKCGDTEIKLKDTVWCQLGIKENEQIDFIVVGDSHSKSSTSLLDDIAHTKGLRGLYAGTKACPAILGIYPYRGKPHPSEESSRCFSYIKDAYLLAKEHDVPNVILISRWDYYVDGSNSGNWNNITDESLKVGDKNTARALYARAVEHTVRQYSDLKTRLIVLLQVPHQKIEPKRIFEDILTDTSSTNKRLELFEQEKKNFLKIDDHLNQQKIANEAWLSQKTAIEEGRLILIDPLNVFCNNGVCPIYDKTVSFYYDDDHASTDGFNRLREKFEQVLNR